ncbi:hypothetical protein [Kitasatospora sp. NPDC089509]|uniref:hypothetical protein n=1 Tax=Kitasatospora sp. NPDC089509 TaxID=3364079 RepID=UPI0037FBBAE2
MAAVTVLPVEGGVRSLAWDGADLVDPAGGGRRWRPEAGTAEPAFDDFGPAFDRAVLSPSGRHAVVHEERGTRGLVVDLAGRRVVRELVRAGYRADDYDYPVALGRLPDGREVLVHCPEEYNVLQIEELASGRRLTEGAREDVDVFHSRPAVSPDGRHLLVAGWVWHPYGIAEVYDLAAALTDPAVLDRDGVLPVSSVSDGIDAEVTSACWLDADRLAIATTDDDQDLGTEVDRLGAWSISARRWLHRSALDHTGGVLLGRGSQVVSLHGHPRLVDVATGAVVAQWPEVPVARRTGCYGVRHIPTPVAALSPDGRRLAVAQDEGIALIGLPG